MSAVITQPYSKITLPELEAIMKTVPGLSGVCISGRYAQAQFTDKDQHMITISILELDETRLKACVLFFLAEDYTIGGLLASNNWNIGLESHDTLSYFLPIDGKPTIILESHLLLKGGVNDANIKAWIENLVEKINPFEENVASIVSLVEANGLNKGKWKEWAEAIGIVAGKAAAVFVDSLGTSGSD